MIPMQPPTQAERFALHRLTLIAEEYRKASLELPAQMQLTLLTIAQNPGITQLELYQRTGLTRVAASRHMKILGPATPDNKKGLGLVVQVADDHDARKRVLNLTAKGAAMMNALIHCIPMKE